MITNSSMTLYHKIINQDTKLEEWVRYNFEKIWWFGGKGAGLNKGYDNANDVEVRIPYKLNKIDVDKIHIGDILVKGTLKTDIKTQRDLSNQEVYNITSIKNNNFGGTPHIHLGGK